MFESVDWSEVFGLTMSPLELIARGTAMFWFLYALFRFVLRRDAGSIAMADVLLFVIIADASQNALSGAYKSVTDGMILVITIVLWNLAVDWAAFRWPLCTAGPSSPTPSEPARAGHHHRRGHRHLQPALVALSVGEASPHFAAWLPSCSPIHSASCSATKRRERDAR